MFPGGYFNGLLMILLFFAVHLRTNTPIEDSDDDFAASEPESDCWAFGGASGASGP